MSITIEDIEKQIIQEVSKELLPETIERFKKYIENESRFIFNNHHSFGFDAEEAGQRVIKNIRSYILVEIKSM